MTYKIIPTKDFIKDCKKIDSLSLTRIRKKFDEVAENPERYKHLRGPLSDFCRIRIGKLRILFSHNNERQEIYLDKIVFDHKY